MIRAGFTIHNPITQSRTTVIEGDAETGGTGWLLEVVCAPGARSDIAEHIHTGWTERFTIVKGTAYYTLDGQQRSAQAGESFVVMPRQRHVHPWSAGDAEMVYHQQNDFGRPSPGAAQEVLGVFATVAELARDGKVGEDGRPKHPLQLAATLRTLNKHGGYDASLPIWAQQILSATLGRLAAALGYHGVHERFVAAK